MHRQVKTGNPAQDWRGRLLVRVEGLPAELARFFSHNDPVFIWLVAAALVVFFWILQSHIGINLSDEGFLWYGSWRVGYGEVPIRDFSSYDPGRYYWTAFWSILFGDGLLGLRAGVALFQVLGLGMGLLAARTVVRNRGYLILIGSLLAVWMFPRHKLFEPALAMGAVYVATLLLLQPRGRRFCVAGFYVGIAAFFGRNVGLYILLAFLAILVVLWWQMRVPLLPATARLFAGIIVGYSPMLFLSLLCSGFFSAFSYSVTSMVTRGSTNLPLPIPWPWTVKLVSQDWLANAHAIFVGVTFIVYVAFFPIALATILRGMLKRVKVQPLLVAATFVGLGYAHHGLVRADLGHLTQAIHPMLLGMVALLAGQAKDGRKIAALTTASGFALLTIIVPAYQQPYVSKLLHPDAFVQEVIRGQRFWITTNDAKMISDVVGTTRRHLKPDGVAFFAPHLPLMYVIIGQRSPVWNTYLLFPPLPEQEARMVEDIQRAPVNCAVVMDLPIDVNTETRFSRTHPRVWNFLVDNYQIVHDEAISPIFTVFVIKD